MPDDTPAAVGARDRALLDHLAAMWRDRDPVPADLVDRSLASLATEDLDRDYELLHLTHQSRELTGARAATSADALTIEFSSDLGSLLVYVSVVDADHRRVDGWVAPPGPATVCVRQGAHAWRGEVSSLGRFEFARLPAGLTRFWLHDGTPEAAPLFATPTVEL